MPKVNNSAREQLQQLEKLVKKVIRKSLKDNTLDYTVQITISSLEPAKLKYAAMISSPAKGVQDVIYVFDSYEKLEEALVQSEKELNRTKVEAAFHENRINTFKNKIQQHEARLVIITDPEYKGDVDEDEDVEIEMEKV